MAQSHDRIPDASMVFCGCHFDARFPFPSITGSSTRTQGRPMNPDLVLLIGIWG